MPIGIKCFDRRVLHQQTIRIKHVNSQSKEEVKQSISAALGAWLQAGASKWHDACTLMRTQTLEQPTIMYLSALLQKQTLEQAFDRGKVR